MVSSNIIGIQNQLLRENYQKNSKGKCQSHRNKVVANKERLLVYTNFVKEKLNEGILPEYYHIK